jgi:hypothetical protein
MTELGDELPTPEDAEKMITDLAQTFASQGKGLTGEARIRMESQWLRLHAMPRKGDTAQTIWERIQSIPMRPKGEMPPPGSPEEQADQERRYALYLGMMGAYEDRVPGAKEVMEEVSKAGQPGPSAREGVATSAHAADLGMAPGGAPTPAAPAEQKTPTTPREKQSAAARQKQVQTRAEMKAVMAQVNALMEQLNENIKSQERPVK